MLLIFISYLEQYHSSYFIDSMDAEFTIAKLCLAYLTSECFEIDMGDDKIRKMIARGDYSFQDYATCNWWHYTGYIKSRHTKLADKELTSLNILISQLYTRHTEATTGPEIVQIREKTDMEAKMRQLQELYELQDRICSTETQRGKFIMASN